MHPVLIQIGPIVIRWYGVMIATACLLGIWVAGREAERKGIDREKCDSIFGNSNFRGAFSGRQTHLFRKYLFRTIRRNSWNYSQFRFDVGLEKKKTAPMESS